MSSFSERMGFKAARTLLQADELDPETRLEVWNVLALLPKFLSNVSTSHESQVLEALWVGPLSKARDEFPPYSSFVYSDVKDVVLNGPFPDAMDLIEAMVKKLSASTHPRVEKMSEMVAGALNGVFERFLVSYRFIGHEMAKIDSSTESAAVTDALEDVQGVSGSRHSLDRAIGLLSDRATPDYPNSIKESISSVESLVKHLTGANTLGAGLKKLRSSGVVIHPSLEQAWLKMYGWTSDEDGIRHGGVEAAVANQELAKYVLVTCAAFLSYLTEAGRKAGLL